MIELDQEYEITANGRYLDIGKVVKIKDKTFTVETRYGRYAFNAKTLRYLGNAEVKARRI